MAATILNSIKHFLMTELEIALSPFRKYLRFTGLAAIFLILSFPFWFLGLAMFLMAMFFYLAEFSKFVNPALWSGFTSMVVAIVLTAGGLASLNKIR